MKILIACEQNTLDSPVSRRFGHAPYYLVVDTISNEIQFLDMDIENLPDHGAAQFKDKGITGVVAGNFGTHAFHDLRAQDIRAYVARTQTAGEAAVMIKDKQLRPIQEETIKKKGPHHSRS